MAAEGRSQNRKNASIGAFNPRTPSGKRKGQMFIVTMVFLAGLIFSVQQLLFSYSALDLSSPFRENEVYILYNVKGMINQTIKQTANCNEFLGKMEGLKSFLDSSSPRGGYITTITYRADCSYWNYAPPQSPPLNVSIKIAGRGGSETYTTMQMYHV
jgi:hypothetical protein